MNQDLIEQKEKIYRYKDVDLLVAFVMGGLISPIGLISFGTWMIVKNTGGNWTPGGIFFIFCGCLPLLANILYGIRFSPVKISRNGVTKIVLRRIWVDIAWSEVLRIEKIQYTDVYPLSSRIPRNPVRYEVVSSTSRLRIDQIIEQFPELTEELNAYAAQHNIELVFYDRRFETEPERRRIAAAMSDRKAARQVRKYGVAQKIERL